jgi:alanyl aminopeptidase
MRFHGAWLFACLVAFAHGLGAADPPKLRLDDSVRPARYTAELTLLPEAPGFSGTIDIEVELRKSTALIWLNATEIQIAEATVETGGKIQNASLEPGDRNFIGLRIPSEVPAGAGKLHIRYEGKISPRNTAGIFQSRDGGESYLFTQFETTDARRAFPCFDQPNFKTPWQVTLHIRKEHKAVSNTPQVSEAEEAGGMKRVVFAPTKPLPSYLVAFAVGSFEMVDGGTAGENHVPVRIVTPKGKSYQARYAAEVTATILERLEKYFGVPYPFEKADQVAIPRTVGFGAMENAGMVTYSQRIILSDPATDTIQRQRNYASDAAHELAHQWLGDLVTLAWWDDAWLNEAFATWAETKILSEWKPEWNTRLSELGGKFGAMSRDSLVSARKIRQPIESMNDIANAFDNITYEKGSAVIRMFESWVGEKQFQAGINSYLKRYAFRNATANDFLDAISGAGQPQLASAFSSFLEQSGVPEVSVKLRCDGAPSVTLREKRYRPIGSSGPGHETWQLPVCVRYQSGQGPQSECFLLDKAEAEFRLAKASACPAYLSADNDAAGYYIAGYDEGLLAELLEQGNQFLTPAERRTLLHDLAVLADAGDVKESQALEAAIPFAQASERAIVSEAQSVVAGVRTLVPSSLRPNYARFVRKLFGDRAEQLGWSAKVGEDSETRLLRASLVPFVAVDGEDAGLQAEARRLADGWLRDRKGVDSDMLARVLTTAAQGGDRAFFDSLLRELNKAGDLQTRGRIIGALGAFRDPKILEAGLDLILHSDLDPRESFNILTGPSAGPETQALRFEFVKANYEALLARAPSGGGFDGGARLTSVGRGFCDATSRREFASFFEERAKQSIGGPRNYAAAIERMQLCEAQKAAQDADVAEFFAKQ